MILRVRRKYFEITTFPNSKHTRLGRTETRKSLTACLFAGLFKPRTFQHVTDGFKSMEQICTPTPLGARSVCADSLRRSGTSSRKLPRQSLAEQGCNHSYMLLA